MMHRSILFSAIIVCVLVLSACSAPTSDSNPAAGTSEISQLDSNDSNSQVEDGALYETTAQYDNPGGGDEVMFKLVVDESGIITDADATPLADNSTSVTRQTAFKDGIKSAVVGKPLAGLTVDRVGGSSLTSKAFNEWVATLNQ